MARFDVFRRRRAEGYLLDCQSDMLRDLNTRFVVPLLDPEQAPTAGRRLNPSFEIDGNRVVMVTQFAGAVAVGELGARVASLIDHDTEITNALDTLMSGV